MKIVHLICAARPNFIKIAPLYHALKTETWFEVRIVHTGQHYDKDLSNIFFEEFDLPSPHYCLNVGGGIHGQQTARTMIEYEKLCLQQSYPDFVIVVGDVNATLACTITAKKQHLRVAHLEAGLRSFDRLMPEEINRIVTDAISDYHWTPSEEAVQNLLNEGIGLEKISFVGNIMMDSYCFMKEKIEKSSILGRLNLKEKEYVLLTLHRPVNVDSLDIFFSILECVGQISMPIVFPIHPRTKKTFSCVKKIPKNIKIIDPQGYVDFMNLLSNASYVISDSGGIQEETTYLGIPCFTLRNTTERPITVSMGSNQLIHIHNLLEKIQRPKKGGIPPLWDGKTAERIKDIIKKIL